MIVIWRRALLLVAWLLLLLPVGGCVGRPGAPQLLAAERPLTVSRAIGQGDATRDASLRLVIEGLDEDEQGHPSRAMAKYQRSIRVDATNPFAYLALARHHLEYGSPREASAFLDQARSLFEAEDHLGPAVDVWGIGLRAWIDRGLGRDTAADSRFATARELGPTIWADELLSAREMR